MQTIRCDMAVVGAGPAGLAGAYEAALVGAKVVLVDENSQPGGQLFKQLHKFFGSRNHQTGKRGFQIAAQLLAQVQEAGVQIMLETTVWGIFPELRLALRQNGRSSMLVPQRVLLATGASENPLAFPGWTLPGVMGVGATQTMINLHRVLPGRRFVIVGAGNIGMIVAHQIVQAGGEIVAVVEVQREVGGYEVHAASLRRQGIPILTRHTVVKVEGADRVEEVVVAQVKDDMNPVPGSEHRIVAEVVCISVGLSPLSELARMAGCDFMYLPELGGYVPCHDEQMQTSIPGLYIAGDLAGIEEASVAIEEGRLAGLQVAASLGLSIDQRVPKSVVQRIDELRLGPFGWKRALAKCRLLGDDEKDLEYPHVTAIFRSRLNVPSNARLRTGAVAVIECFQEIPCNQCDDICPSAAIRIGSSISNLPSLDQEKCNGCGLCIPACPARAIFVVDLTYSPREALVHLPFDLLPVPKVNSVTYALDRDGEKIATARVVQVRSRSSFNGTLIVSLVVPKDLAMRVRGFSPPEQASDETIICRCEEIRLGEIRAAIRAGATTVDWVKRITRAGMGTCQGSSCGATIARIISEETGQPIEAIAPDTRRPPVRMISLDELGRA